MDISSLNKCHFHFVCTNYGSNKDGIGHYTSKIVNELRKNDLIDTSVYSSNTYNLSRLKLFFSLRMSKELMRLLKVLFKSSNSNYIILEYPFVEYNPIFLIFFILLKIFRKPNTKIVISLHEYSRTNTFRKLFIKALIKFSDIVLYTKIEDVNSFLEKEMVFRKRMIPANIEPSEIKKTKIQDSLNICFFGIINFETKDINNMLKGWNSYLRNSNENRIQFHFISSTYDESVKSNQNVNFHCGLEDDEVSCLLQKMQFMILPLKPKISINNGSLSVGCIHGCIPVGVFDVEYFDKDFGLNMETYSIQAFENMFNFINILDVSLIEEKRKLAYEYGRTKSIVNSVESYSSLIEIL